MQVEPAAEIDVPALRVRPVGHGVHLGAGQHEIRREVHAAVRLLGAGGGLALTPAEAVFASTPWESIATVFAAWREVCTYPIDA